MFEQLPTELYESILNHVPSSELQQTLLSVTRAIPLSPVPISHLFHSIRITYPARAVHLYRRLRPRKTSDLSGNNAADLVKEFSVECWSVDAEIIVNLIHLLPKLQRLNIWIGPDSFTPEHLEEMFLKPFLELKYLSLRFRPYVEKATYYQFLKGAYFDSTLLAISRWPTVTLPTLSIIQDPLQPGMVVKRHAFAQPIVFFRLDSCLSTLIHSTALCSSLTSLRIQIPARPVVLSLCTATAYSAVGPHSPLIPPDLVFLDLSTCNILMNDLHMLLVHFTSLRHIILDGCDIFRGESLLEGEFKALGKLCALVGVLRAREREKMLKSWMESRIIPDATDDGFTGDSTRPARKAKPGRKGLSTASISFRTPSTNPVTLLESTSSLAKGKCTIAKSKKIRILPSLPDLLSLSISVPVTIQTDDYPIIRGEFYTGWEEGIAQLTVTRARMRTSAGNGVRVMRQVCKGGSEESDEEDEGFEGLVDIDPDDLDAFGTDSGLQAPVLCFAGPNREGDHQSNCGHVIGWNLEITS